MGEQNDSPYGTTTTVARSGLFLKNFRDISGNFLIISHLSIISDNFSILIISQPFSKVSRFSCDAL